MKKKIQIKKIIFIKLLLVFGSIITYAQKNNIYEIKLSAFKTKEATLLRWAIVNPEHWRKAYQLGFTIERAEIGTNNYIKLNKVPIKAPKKETINKLDTNSVFFKTAVFTSIEPDYSTAKGRRTDSIVGMMYLLQSAKNFDAACFSGAGFKDTSAIVGKKYYYKISVASLAPNQQNSNLVEVSKVDTISPPVQLRTTFKDGEVLLSWDNATALANKFNFFIIERAEDGDVFKPIDIPFLKNISKGDKMVYTDQVENEIHYNYRIKFMNLFGMVTAPSNIASGVAHAMKKN